MVLMSGSVAKGVDPTLRDDRARPSRQTLRVSDLARIGAEARWCPPRNGMWPAGRLSARVVEDDANPSHRHRTMTDAGIANSACHLHGFLVTGSRLDVSWPSPGREKGFHRASCASKGPDAEGVALISGGGAGHEPAHEGDVG